MTRETRDDAELAWLPILTWATTGACLVVVQLLSRHWDRLGQLFSGQLDGPRVYLGGWVGRDSTEYLSIATEGYQQRQLVHFPLYPILMQVADVLPHDLQFAAIVVSAASGAAVAVGLWHWLGRVGATGRARTFGLLAVLLYPYGWFLYGVVYSDALFIALTVWAFLMVERDRLLLAAAAGALASATRPAGVAVAVALLLVTLERHGVLHVRDGAPRWVQQLKLPTRLDRGRFRWRLLAPLLSCVGIGAYMTYQWVAWGHPLLWVTEQSNYHDPGWRSLFKQQYFDAWYQGYESSHLATTTFQAVLLAVVVCSVPAVGRRYGWGYGVYVLCLAAMPAFSVATFMGTGRYLLAAFPALTLFGEWLSARRVVGPAVLGVAVVVVGVMTAAFARGVYLT